MNKRQKEVIKKSLTEEQKQLKMLERLYEQAAKDTSKKIAELSARKDMENLQSIIYQKRYQQAILKQINSTLKDLQSNSYKSIDDYMNKCYELGYIGTMYDLHGQGIPITIPIDKKAVTRALKLDSKLSQGLYNRLGEDTSYLKKLIRAEISRGIVEGKSWNEVAECISRGMTSPFKTAKNNAMRIARTEGHRIQMEATRNAQKTAIDHGAEVVKQWDATLDGRTRKSHALCDGEIREFDEPFSNGLMFPSDPKGHPADVCNCRCALLQRAVWSLDASELDQLRQRASFFGLDKSDNFDDFSKKYLKVTDNGNTITSKTNIGGLSAYPKKHQQAILDQLDKAEEQYKKAWNDACNDFHSITGKDYKLKTGKQAKGAFYSPYCDAVYLNISKVSKGSSYEAPYQVVFHEYGHHMDYIMNRKYGNGDKGMGFTETFKDGIFGKTVKQEGNNALERFAKKHNLTDRREIESEFAKYINDKYSLMARSDISDMFEPIFTTKSHPFGTGHGASYWRNRDNGKEAFAEMYSAAVSNPESWKVIKEFFPESVKIFKSMLKVVK